MTAKAKNYSIWLVPQKKDGEYLTDVIKNLAKKFDSPVFGPHISVYDATIEKEQLIKILKDCTLGMRPFNLQVDKLNYTDHIFKTVFAEIEEDEILNNLYERLKNALKNFGEYEMKPHISLIYKKMPSQEKVEIIKSLNIKTEFTFGSLAAVFPDNETMDWYDVPSWKTDIKVSFGEN